MNDPVDIIFRINNGEVDRQTQRVVNSILGIGSASNQATAGVSNLERSMRNAFAGLAGTAALGSFAKQIVNVRGEIQALEASFEVLLGNKQKADAMLASIKAYAVESPLSLTGVSNAAQTLLGFNIEAEKVIPIIRQIGDISMGNEQRFQSLILAFSQMSSTGKLMGQDLNQMINAGFNPLQEIAARTGKSIAELKEEMGKGAISAEMVADAFKSATEEGGKFYGMTAKQADGIRGLQAQLTGALQDKLNEIGTLSEGIITTAYKGAIALVENYKEIGEAVLALIATYGTYKAAVVAVSVAQQLQMTVLRQAVVEKRLAAMAGIQLSNAEAVAAAQTKVLTIAKQNLVKSLKAVTAAMTANPYALAAAAVVALGYGIYKLINYNNELSKSQKLLNDSHKEYTTSVESERVQIDLLFDKLRKAKEGTKEYQKAKDEIIDKYGSYLSGLKEEIKSLKDVEGAYKAISKAAIQAAKDRVIAEGTKKAADDYAETWGEAIEKIGKKFKEKFGEDQASALIASLKSSLETGRGFSAEVENAIAEFDRRVTSKTGEKYENYIKSLVSNITTAKKTLNETYKSLNDIYGEQQQTATDGGATVVFQNIKTESEAARKKVAELKKEIADLRDGKTQSVDLNADIEKKLKELETAEKVVETLTGINKKAEARASKQEVRSFADDQKRLQEIKEMQEKIKEQEVEGELETQQLVIDSMEEGSAKELAQIALNYDRRKLESAKKANELIKQQQELEKKIWESKNPDWKEKKLTFTPTTTSVSQLSEAQQRQLGDEAFLSAELRKKADTDLLNDLLNKYQDYSDERRKLEEEFNKDVESLNKLRNESNSAEIDRAIANRKKKFEESQKEISNAEVEDAVENSALLEKLYSDTSTMSRKRLGEVLTDTKQLVDYLDGVSDELPIGITKEQAESIKQNAGEVRKVYEGLSKAQDEFNKKGAKYPFKEIVDGFKKLKESEELAKKAAKATGDFAENYAAMSEKAKEDGLKYITQGATVAANTIGSLSDKIKELSEITGNESQAEFAEGLKVGADALGAAAQGFAQGGWIGAVVNGVGSLVTSVVTSIAQADAYTAQFEKDRLEFLQQYELMLLRIKDADYESVFGINVLQKSIDASQKAIDALKKYNELTTSKNQLSSGGLQNLQIKTKDYSWAQEFFMGERDEYKTLKQIAPQLWDNGIFDIDAAKEFLATNTQIKDEVRQAVQNAIDLGEAYEDAIEIVREDIKDTFGYLGTDMTTQIIDAVKNGTSAWEGWKDVGIQAIESLGEKLMYELFFASKMSKLQADLEAVYANESDPEAIADKQASVMDDFFNSLGSTVDAAQAWAEEWKRRMEEKGYNAWAAEEVQEAEDTTVKTQERQKGSFETLSQATGDLLLGQFTAFRIHSSNMDDTLKRMETESKLVTSHLAAIEQNTFDTVTELKSVNKLLKRADTEGLKIR
jgi:tape measure domain-containing protein